MLDKISQLSISLTFKCPVSCESCIINCSPKRKEIINFDLIKKFLRQSHDKIPMEFIGITGGEPFFIKDYLYQTMEYIYKNYNLKISVISNCYWAKKLDHSIYELNKLRKIGLTELIISSDEFHQKYIPINNIINAIKASKKIGLEVTLRHVFTKTNTTDSWIEKILGKDFSRDDLFIIDSIHDVIDKNKNRKIKIEKQPCMPMGRAKTGVVFNEIPSKKLNLKDEEINSACLSIYRIIHMFTNGDISFCCGALPGSRNLIFGNLHSESLSKIISKAEYSPILNIMSTRGLASILNFMKSENLVLPKEYSGICHLCSLIFSNKENQSSVLSYLKNNMIKYFIERKIFENNAKSNIS